MLWWPGESLSSILKPDAFDHPTKHGKHGPAALVGPVGRVLRSTKHIRHPMRDAFQKQFASPIAILVLANDDGLEVAHAQMGKHCISVCRMGCQL